LRHKHPTEKNKNILWNIWISKSKENKGMPAYLLNTNELFNKFIKTSPSSIWENESLSINSLDNMQESFGTKSLDNIWVHVSWTKT
jgi:hypothetical protein